MESYEQLNRRVKQTFAEYMPHDTTGFNPLAAWDAGRDIIPKAQRFKAGTSSKAVALVTTRGEFYSILLFGLSGAPEEWCVGGIKKVAPMDSYALKRTLDPRAPVLGAHRCG